MSRCAARTWTRVSAVLAAWLLAACVSVPGSGQNPQTDADRPDLQTSTGADRAALCTTLARAPVSALLRDLYFAPTVSDQIDFEEPIEWLRRSYGPDSPEYEAASAALRPLVVEGLHRYMERHTSDVADARATDIITRVCNAAYLVS